MMHKPIDFSQVETLRKHMLLNKADMADLFEVSRITYHNWTQGGKLRKKSDEKVRAMLRKLLDQVNAGWPDPSINVMSQDERFAELKRRLGIAKPEPAAEPEPEPETEQVVEEDPEASQSIAAKFGVH